MLGQDKGWFIEFYVYGLEGKRKNRGEGGEKEVIDKLFSIHCP
jgi:hypothetical protein